MKIITMEPSAALAKGRALPYALVRGLSAETLGPTPAEIPLEELLEARFFSPTEEIRIFRRDGALEAAALEEDGSETFWDQTYEIANPDFGARITVRSYLDVDEDGQAYWGHARLTDWRGGTEDA